MPTYLDATEEMKTVHGAADYPLRVNWRSDQDLLDGLNCIFSEGEWFPQASRIRYVDVHAPDGDARRTGVEDDRTGRPPITLVDLAACERLKQAQKKYAGFVAHEIAQLLDQKNGPRFCFALKKEEPGRPLHAGDICILVMKRKEAEPITQALDLAGVPYSFYKQTGLWQSEEATHLGVLLQALAAPEERTSFRKALLTCFFRVKPEDLVRARRCADAASGPIALSRLAWLRRGAGLVGMCRSLLEDTGLLFADRGEAAGQRRLADLRHRSSPPWSKPGTRPTSICSALSTG